MKTLAVVISGLPANKNFREIDIQPGTTAGDVLKALSLEGYLLSREGSAQAFANEEEIYPVFESGSKVRATPIAEVGAPAWLGALFRWLGLGNLFRRRVRVRSKLRPEKRGPPRLPIALPGGRVQVAADRRPLWETRGWRRLGNGLVGAFRTPRGSVAGEIKTSHHVPEFYIINPPTALLQGSHGERRGQFRESFHYATGLQVGADSFAITEVLPVEFAEQSAVGVRVADRSSIAAFNRLEQKEMPLVAHFHSHPGHGATANCPSATDFRFQERLERGGHVAIGGIFARGGDVAHVRFSPHRVESFKFTCKVVWSKGLLIMSSNWPWPTVVHRAPCVDIDVMGAEVADRQNRVDGFKSEDYQLKRLAIIGAGGLGGPIASGAARKGIGRIDIIDDDTVELTNLSRQYFSEDDLFQPKALRLARNVSSMDCFGTHCVGHYTSFNEESIPWFEGFDAVVVGVDNNRTRATAARFCKERGLPGVFVAADDSANYLWTFIQHADGPCLGCVFPRMAVADDDRQRCRPVAAVIDTGLVAAGLVLFALNTVLLSRRCAWNFRSLHF